jgi:hypothetical protein
MTDDELSDLLLTLGSANTTESRKEEAWLLCTIDDEGYINFVKREYLKRNYNDYYDWEDMVQEVCIKIRLSAHEYKAIRTAHGWRRKVTINFIKDKMKTPDRRENNVKTIRFMPRTGIEDLLGDDPSFPPRD